MNDIMDSNDGKGMDESRLVFKIGELSKGVDEATEAVRDLREAQGRMLVSSAQFGERLVSFSDGMVRFEKALAEYRLEFTTLAKDLKRERRSEGRDRALLWTAVVTGIFGLMGSILANIDKIVK